MKLVNPDSIPSDVNASLFKLARKGLRVLAFAYREFPLDDSCIPTSMSQESLEDKNLKYLCLISLKNSLKADTCWTIETLTKASLRCKMITGDHVYTGIAIAQDCGILRKSTRIVVVEEDKLSLLPVLMDGETEEVIPAMSIKDLLSKLDGYDDVGNPLLSAASQSTGSKYEFSESDVAKRASSQDFIEIAMSGRGLVSVREHMPEYLHGLIKHCKVFARTKPYDKKFVVDMLMLGSSMGQKRPVSDGVKQEELFQVLFCGDGANDMAALRSATVGVSLCDAETSVAAPITSRLQTPGSVVDVIKEGRCSLITAYVLVNFNIMYGVIQLFMALLSYTYGLAVGDYIYLLHDLFFTLVLGLCISSNPPAPALSKEIPPSRFFSIELISKLFSQLVCFPLFQFFGLCMLRAQTWYVEYDPGTVVDIGDLGKYSDENSVLAFIGLIQLMIASVVANIDHPFRKSWFKNKYHIIAFFLQGIFMIFIMFSPDNAFLEAIQIKPLDQLFCFLLLLLMLLNLVVSLLLNHFARKVKYFYYSLISSSD